MTREGLDTILENLRTTHSTEDSLIADHIEDVMVSNDLEPWEDVQEYVKSSLEEVRSAANFVLEQLIAEGVQS